MAFFNRRVDPRIPDTVEWDTQIIEGATVAEFAELPARYGIRTTQIFNPDAVTCEIADDEYSPFTALTRIYTGSPTASEYYADGGSAYIFLHADNLGKYARTSIYPGGTVITAERLASDEFKGATGATGPTGATGATGATGPAGPAMDAAINAATDKTSPADADRLGFTDSADSYNLKRFTFANLWTWILSKIVSAGAGTPVGTYIQHAGATAPTGFLACDGASLLRAGTYADLFAVIGTTYGAADGTHFNLPDARGLVMVGAGAHGSMTRADASAYDGGTVGATRDDQRQGGILKITDSIDGYGTAASGSINNAGGNRGFLITSGPDGRVEARVHATDGVNGTPRTGNETRPAEIAVLVCIKY